MATFDVTDHPLLSDDANAIDADVLEAFNDLAEDLLGLAAAETEDATIIATATRAVVWQVNYMVGLHENEGSFQTAITLGPLRRQFRDEDVHPIAKKIATGIAEALGLGDNDMDNWEVVQSLR